MYDESLEERVELCHDPVVAFQTTPERDLREHVVSLP
jgi:hypothetical protein